jgi:hypothetical protein
MLTNHEGMATSTDDFKGEWVLLYFGFTACPDICPEELKKINRVITALDQKWCVGGLRSMSLRTVCSNWCWAGGQVDRTRHSAAAGFHRP